MSKQSDQRSEATPAEVANFLRQFNDWRRGLAWPQPDPTAIGEAIDSAIEMLNRLELIETEVARHKFRHEAPDGSWLWCKLMDWCKSRRVPPAEYSDLFAIAGEAHKLNSEKAKND